MSIATQNASPELRGEVSGMAVLDEGYTSDQPIQVGNGSGMTLEAINNIPDYIVSTNKWAYIGTGVEFVYKNQKSGEITTQRRMTTCSRVKWRDRSKYNPKDCFAKGNR